MQRSTLLETGGLGIRDPKDQNMPNIPDWRIQVSTTWSWLVRMLNFAILTSRNRSSELIHKALQPLLRLLTSRNGSAAGDSVPGHLRMQDVEPTLNSHSLPQ